MGIGVAHWSSDGPVGIDGRIDLFWTLLGLQMTKPISVVFSRGSPEKRTSWRQLAESAVVSLLSVLVSRI